MDDATKQLVLAESLKCFKMNNNVRVALHADCSYHLCCERRV